MRALKPLQLHYAIRQDAQYKDRKAIIELLRDKVPVLEKVANVYLQTPRDLSKYENRNDPENAQCIEALFSNEKEETSPRIKKTSPRLKGAIQGLRLSKKGSRIRSQTFPSEGDTALNLPSGAEKSTNSKPHFNHEDDKSLIKSLIESHLPEVEIAQYLLEWADQNKNIPKLRFCDDCNVLHFLVLKNKWETIRILIRDDRFARLVSQSNNRGELPIFYTASLTSDRQPILELLLKHFPEYANIPNKVGKTAKDAGLKWTADVFTQHETRTEDEKNEQRDKIAFQPKGHTSSPRKLSKSPRKNSQSHPLGKFAELFSEGNLRPLNHKSAHIHALLQDLIDLLYQDGPTPKRNPPSRSGIITNTASSLQKAIWTLTSCWKEPDMQREFDAQLILYRAMYLRYRFSLDQILTTLNLKCSYFDSHQKRVANYIVGSLLGHGIKKPETIEQHLSVFKQNNTDEQFGLKSGAEWNKVLVKLEKFGKLMTPEIRYHSITRKHKKNRLMI